MSNKNFVQISGLMYGMNLQKGCSPVMRELLFFHDKAMYILMVISFLVGGSLLALWVFGESSLDFMEHKMMEMVWTLLPVFMLVSLALPSLKLLYFIDVPSSVAPFVTLKAVGHQWYWSYFFTSPKGEEDFGYDSYMVPTKELNNGDFRLLEVDHPMFLPRNSYIRLLTTSADVIHSFAIPALGVKIDAVPGRLNQVYFYPTVLGSFYGQCSEICGANHSFMPMLIEVVPREVYSNSF